MHDGETFWAGISIWNEGCRSPCVWSGRTLGCQALNLRLVHLWGVELLTELTSHLCGARSCSWRLLGSPLTRVRVRCGGRGRLVPRPLAPSVAPSPFSLILMSRLAGCKIFYLSASSFFLKYLLYLCHLATCYDYRLYIMVFGDWLPSCRGYFSPLLSLRHISSI